MKKRIIRTYARKGDPYLIMISHRVVTKTEGNPNFPTPPEALGKAKQLLPEFQTAVSYSGGRDMEKSAVKNDLRVELVSALDEVAEYVTGVSNEDRAILLSSGFDLSGEKTGVTLGAIQQLAVNIDRANEAVTSIKRVSGAKAYVHQYAVDPVTSDSIWTSKFVTDISCTFTGLQSRQKYVFRVIAIGPAGQEAYSPVVAKVIQ